MATVIAVPFHPWSPSTSSSTAEEAGDVRDVLRGRRDRCPSIVAGLFIYTFWVLTFRLHRSGFAAAFGGRRS